MIPGRASPTKVDSTTKAQGRKSRPCVVAILGALVGEGEGKSQSVLIPTAGQWQSGRPACHRTHGVLQQTVPRLFGALAITF